jgi:hypothetical protein
MPDVGRVRKDALTAKPESGRRDSSRRLPTTRSDCLNQRRRLVPRDGCGTEEADSRRGCDSVGATAAFPAAAPAADVRHAWQSNGPRQGPRYIKMKTAIEYGVSIATGRNSFELLHDNGIERRVASFHESTIRRKNFVERQGIVGR